MPQLPYAGLLPAGMLHGLQAWSDQPEGAGGPQVTDNCVPGKPQLDLLHFKCIEGLPWWSGG